VFGVRPGSPFLFTIAATGERPIRFDAQGLPDRLRVDAWTGQISGSVSTPGDYHVTLTALALTPHMGWNSWYVWENHVTDRIVREAADAVVRSGLADHGYQYVNIDDCWTVKPGAKEPELQGPERDEQGRVNTNARFPDMKALTDHIHGLGLKAGIYTSPGPRTCAGHVGAYRHEEQDAARFVEWGFDFLKYDWCSYDEIAGREPTVEALQKPYRQMGAILKRQPRDLVLNLCQYGMGKVWQWGREVGGNSWRTAGDLGLKFEEIGTALFRDGFDVYADDELHRFGGPGGWNDPDYLLIGRLSNGKGTTAPTPHTPNEQYAHVSLWSLLAAPLIFSGDVTRLDPFTVSLLTNDEVIDVDQDPLGRPGRRVWKQGPLEVWARDLEDGSKAPVQPGRGHGPGGSDRADLGVSGRQAVRDLWPQKDVGVLEGRCAAPVGRHGVVLLKLTPSR
jgi:alpha-galactosidase